MQGIPVEKDNPAVEISLKNGYLMWISLRKEEP